MCAPGNDSKESRDQADISTTMDRLPCLNGWGRCSSPSKARMGRLFRLSSRQMSASAGLSTITHRKFGVNAIEWIHGGHGGHDRGCTIYFILFCSSTIGNRAVWRDMFRCSARWLNVFPRRTCTQYQAPTRGSDEMSIEGRDRNHVTILWALLKVRV